MASKYYDDIFALDKDIVIITFNKVSYSDIKLCDTYNYFNEVIKDEKRFDMARLAAGGAILSAKLAYENKPSFACIRPPGHHAYKDSSWGFCTFNNIAIAIKSLINKNKIKNAIILDFDAHTGDGTRNILSDLNEITIINPMAEKGDEYVMIIKNELKKIGNADIVGVSAGFDSSINEMGGKLTNSHYYSIGNILKRFCKNMNNDRRFSVLEGGYNQKYLGKSVLSFLQGFS